MSQNNIKTAYQNSKIAKGNITDERLLLGKREIQTLKLLSRACNTLETRMNNSFS